MLRLVPKPPCRATLRATFDGIEAAVEAVNELLRARVVPATLELVDGECLAAVSRYLGAAAGAGGNRGAAAPRSGRDEGRGGGRGAPAWRRPAGRPAPREVLRAASEAEREELWRVRRELSPALKTISTTKFNHDVVVPRGRVPELFALDRRRCGAEFRLDHPVLRPRR